MIVSNLQDDETSAESLKRGFQIMGLSETPIGVEECEACLAKLPATLSQVPYPVGRVDAELIKGRYLSSVGLIYGMLIEKAFGWSLCQIRPDDSEEDDTVDAVVSPDRSYFVYPIGVVYKEAHRHSGETRAVYEKIKRGDLPNVPPGSFHEIKP